MIRRLRITHLEDRVTPAIATWDGGGANQFWTTPANWVGDVAPQPGDDLVFPFATQITAVNDFAPGTAFRSIALNNSGYQVSGNAIAISNGIASNGAVNGGTIALDLTLTAPQTLSHSSGSGYTLSGSINLNGHVLTATINGGGGGGVIPSFPGIVRFTGPVTGNGGIIKDGIQWLVLSGNNTFMGTIDLRSGHLSFGSNNAAGAEGSANPTLVAGGAVLNIEIPNLIIPETITFADREVTNANPLAVFGSSGFVQGPVTFTGPVTLQGSSRWIGEVTLGGGLYGVGPLSVGGGYPLTFPAGTVSPFNGFLFSEGNALVFNGSGPFGLITANDIFSVSGTGTIGPLTAQGQTRFRPGGQNGVGTLTTGNLIEGAFYDAEISAAGNDKVVVNGTATIAGTLTVFPLGGFTPPAGSVFRIIDNDGTDPIVGAFGNLPQGAAVTTINGVPLFVNYRGGTGNDVELTTTQPPPPPGPRPFFAVGAGAGGGPHVQVYDESGALVRSFFAYEAAFTGGVHVATADMTGDGVRDIITAPGFGGGPVIRIWDGSTGGLVNQYLAYDVNFRGGVFIAAGRMNADSVPDIVTGAGRNGGPHVKVFNAGTANVLIEFLAYDPSFTGGVSVGAIDFVNTGSFNDQGIVITGAGPGGGPHVKTFGGLSGGGLASVFAYEASFTGGVFVAGTTSPAPNIVVGPGAGRAPQVRVFNTGGVEQSNFFAYDPAFLGGVTVGHRALTGGGSVIVTGAGPSGGPHVKEFNFPGLTVRNSFFAFDPAFLGGVFVG